MAAQKETGKNDAAAGENARETFVPQYDLTSKERYVDSMSQKTEFEKVIGELARISLESLSWDIVKMTKKHFGEAEEDNALKWEAYLGGFIVNAAAALYDKGLGVAAYKKLDEARKVLETKEKLAQETEAIRLKTEEDSIDVSDILGLFSDEAG